jgi:hypothetical protein
LLHSVLATLEILTEMSIAERGKDVTGKRILVYELRNKSRSQNRLFKVRMTLRREIFDRKLSKGLL